MDIVWPVQASRARPASIQSVVPSRLTVVIEVKEALVDISAVTGLVEEIRWYRKGILRNALRKGSSIESVETAWETFHQQRIEARELHPTFSAFPSTPTRLPRRVYRIWDADSETESSENGDPRTSNRASTFESARSL